jgi:hypothetical protein
MMVGWGVRHMVALWQCIKEEQNLVETWSHHPHQLLFLAGT